MIFTLLQAPYLETRSSIALYTSIALQSESVARMAISVQKMQHFDNNFKELLENRGASNPSFDW